MSQEVAETSMKDVVAQDQIDDASRTKQLLEEQVLYPPEQLDETSLKDGAEENNLNIESAAKEEIQEQIQVPAEQPGKDKQNHIFLHTFRFFKCIDAKIVFYYFSCMVEESVDAECLQFVESVFVDNAEEVELVHENGKGEFLLILICCTFRQI